MAHLHAKRVHRRPWRLRQLAVYTLVRLLTLEDVLLAKDRDIAPLPNAIATLVAPDLAAPMQLRQLYVSAQILLVQDVNGRIWRFWV